VTYFKWYETHSKKHSELIQKLLKKGLTKYEIIDYFNYKNLSKAEPNFCILFKNSQKCHDIEELNCFLCGCPNFRFYFKNSSSKIVSFCSIDSSMGDKFIDKNGNTHQDCSKCELPHLKKYIVKNFDINWQNIMKDVVVE
jgi:Zn-finger protein